MPGAKRRALKKLLQQNQAADSASASPISTTTPNGDTSSASFSETADAAADHESVTVSGRTSPVGESADSSSHKSTKGTHAKSESGVSGGGGGMYGGSALLAAMSGGGHAGGGGGGKKKSSKQRFAERQARKKQTVLDTAPPSDPAWNAQLEKERQEEIQVISDACAILNVEINEIQPDGHCMYSAVADQLGVLGILPASNANNPYHVRRVAAQYIRDHQDDFLPFLAGIDGEDMPGSTEDGLMTPEQFTEYCKRVESTAEWGGEPEIQALSRVYNVPIHVIQRGPPTVVSHGGSTDTFGGAMDAKSSLAAGDRVVRISYHRRMYGLGEHYNSLRPI